MAEQPLTLSVRRLATSLGLDLPRYETAGASGLDLRAALDADAPQTLPSGEVTAVPTGLAHSVIPLGALLFIVAELTGAISRPAHPDDPSPELSEEEP